MPRIKLLKHKIVIEQFIVHSRNVYDDCTCPHKIFKMNINRKAGLEAKNNPFHLAYPPSLFLS